MVFNIFSFILIFFLMFLVGGFVLVEVDVFCIDFYLDGEIVGWGI